MKYIVDIKGEIEGDYEIIGKYEERPQGEWITHQTGMLLWEECNQCHAQVGTIGMNFCPNCGADMKGGADNGN